jgi:hypothetical protein
MSFCKCPVDIRSRNQFGDEWCTICGCARFTDPPPAQETPVLDCPHTQILADPVAGASGLVQCARCARIGTRGLSGDVAWWVPPRAPSTPPSLQIRRWVVFRADTEERVWGGKAEDMADALRRAHEACRERPELIGIRFVATGIPEST